MKRGKGFWDRVWRFEKSGEAINGKVVDPQSSKSGLPPTNCGLPKGGPAVLRERIERTKTVNNDAAKLLARHLDECFTRPWNVRELGEARGARREQIRACQNDLKSPIRIERGSSLVWSEVGFD
jgi:hypothetical protein